MMQILLILGVIAALIYYILKMRANAQSRDDESDEANGRGFMNDVFISPGGVKEDYTGSKADNDDEQDADKALLGDPYSDLEKLAALHEKGILTQEEYSAKKKDLLDRI
jgi:hypothetical protein